MAALSTTNSAWLQPTIAGDGSRGVAPIDRIWNRFDGMYGSLWRSNFPGEQAIQNWRETWAQAFESERLTVDEVANGLSACLRACKMPPTLPAFLELCRPPINPEVAYFEAVEQMRRRHHSSETERQRERWSHPAIFFAAARFGGELGQHGYNSQKGLWCALLKSAMDDYAAGKNTTVPPRREALPAPDVSLTPEQRAKKIQLLKEVAGIGRADSTPAEQTEEQRQAELRRIDEALQQQKAR